MIDVDKEVSTRSYVMEGAGDAFRVSVISESEYIGRVQSKSVIRKSGDDWVIDGYSVKFRKFVSLRKYLIDDNKRAVIRALRANEY